MGQKNERIKETEAIHRSHGIKFVDPNNKSIRLYFQSQFSDEMEDEDLDYLNHIFEIKTLLFFNKYYDKRHLLNTDKFLEETFEKNIETIYRNIKILEVDFIDKGITNVYLPLQLVSDKNFLEQLFKFNIKKKLITKYEIFTHASPENKTSSFSTPPEVHVYYNKTCKINYELMGVEEYLNQTLLLNPDFVDSLAITDEVEIYNLLNEHTDVIYFVLMKILMPYAKIIKKIVIHQIGLKDINENMYTILASFLRSENSDKIESVSILSKTKRVSKYNDLSFNDEQLENPIINRQHFFNFYSSLANKTNLIELRVLLFIKDYNLILLSNVIHKNKNLKILQVRNVACESDTTRANILDFAFFEFTNLGENIRDEVFIFFNYISQLEYLEELQITHFWFNSEINLLACETTKKMKYLKVLSLEKNQAILNNDMTVLNNFNLQHTNLETLNLGYTYFNMIRCFDFIINVQKLKELNLGVLDFISFSTFIKFTHKTVLEKVTIILNKPFSIDSIPIMFDQLINYAFKATKLKFLYILNAYTNSTYKHPLMNGYLRNLIGELKLNNSIRKLSFRKPCIYYTNLKDNESDGTIAKRTFRYINKKKINLCSVVILIIQGLYTNRYTYKFKSRSDNDIFLYKIFKNVVQFAFATYRKVVLE